MNTSAVYESVRLLPSNSVAYRANPPSFGRKTTNPPLAAHTRWAEATNDPQWAWRIAHGYYLSKEPLPPWISDPNIRRAYHYLRGARDEQMAIVHGIRTSAEYGMARPILQGLLCAKDITLEDIAALLGLETEVVMMFERLFFNVRNRENLYDVNLAFPLTRLGAVVEAEKGYDDPERTLMRVGRDYGWRAVADCAGLILPGDPKESAEAMLADTERAIVANGRLLARVGRLNHPDSPGMRHSKSLMMRAKKEAAIPQTSDDKLGLGSFGMKFQVLEHFRRMSEEDVRYRIALQHQQVMREQQVETKRATANQ